MFDVDNSGTIIVDEIHDSVQVMAQVDTKYIFCQNAFIHTNAVSLEDP